MNFWVKCFLTKIIKLNRFFTDLVRKIDIIHSITKVYYFSNQEIKLNQKLLYIFNLRLIEIK